MTRNELLGQLKRGNFNMLKQFPGLSSDPSLMIEAYELNEGILDYIDISLMKDEDFFYELALINPEVIKGTEFAGKKDFIRKLVGEVPETVNYMQKRLFDDPVFVVELATAGAETTILNKMGNDPEIKNVLQRLALGDYMYVDNFELTRQTEMIEKGEISEELSNNVEFMEHAIAKDISYIDKLGEKLIVDRDNFNEIYRANTDAFDKYMENKYKKLMESKDSDEDINKYLDESKSAAEEKSSKPKGITVGHLEDKAEKVNQEKPEEMDSKKGEEKDNSAKLIKAIGYACVDDCLDELIGEWEKKAAAKAEEILTSENPEKVEKAKKALSGLNKKINDAKEKIKTPEGREALLKENENDTSLRKLQRAKELRNNALLPRAGIVDINEALTVLNNKNASSKSIDDKFTKAFKGVTGKIDAHRISNKEKKISNHLVYFIENPEEIEKWVTDDRDKKLLFKFIDAHNKAKERELKNDENPLTIGGDYCANVREEMKSVAIDALREEEENLEQQMKFATPEEKKELTPQIKGVKTKIKNLTNNKSLDYTVKELINKKGNEELKELVAKDIYATVVIVAEKVKKGENVSEKELRKSANESNKYLEQVCPDLYEKVQEKMFEENPGNRNKPVSEYLIKNMDLLYTLIPEENKEERIKAGRILKEAEVVQNAIEGREKEKNEAKENLNTRDEEEK